MTCDFLRPAGIVIVSVIIFTGAAMRKLSPGVLLRLKSEPPPILFHLVASSYHICVVSDQVIKRTAIIIGIARVMSWLSAKKLGYSGEDTKFYIKYSEEP